MTFSYTTPPATDVDRVRFYARDTEEKPWSVSDEEIQFLLAENAQNVMAAAAAVADRIGDHFAVQTTGTTKHVGPTTISRRDVAETARGWRELAAKLRSGSPSGAVVIADASLFTGSQTRPTFELGMNDNGTQRPHQTRLPENGVW